MYIHVKLHIYMSKNRHISSMYLQYLSAVADTHIEKTKRETEKLHIKRMQCLPQAQTCISVFWLQRRTKAQRWRGRGEWGSDNRFSVGNSLDPRAQCAEDCVLSSFSSKNCYSQQSFKFPQRLKERITSAVFYMVRNLFLDVNSALYITVNFLSSQLALLLNKYTFVKMVTSAADSQGSGIHNQGSTQLSFKAETNVNTMALKHVTTVMITVLAIPRSAISHQ